MFNPREKRTVIFDFDGTLVDIETVFVEIFNLLVPEFNYPPIAPENISKLKGMSARNFVQNYLHIPLWNIYKLYQIEHRAKEEYHKRLQDIQLFPGMPEVVKALQESGRQTGIMSSGASSSISALLARDNIHFDFIYPSSIFGKALALKKVLKQEKLLKGAVVYVGDEVRDVEACQQIGIDIIAVTWGLNDEKSLTEAGATALATKPSEILETLGLPIKNENGH